MVACLINKSIEPTIFEFDKSFFDNWQPTFVCRHAFEILSSELVDRNQQITWKMVD
jgi:hypothetical protein